VTAQQILRDKIRTMLPAVWMTNVRANIPSNAG
jgi:hypothetical protein